MQTRSTFPILLVLILLAGCGPAQPAVAPVALTSTAPVAGAATLLANPTGPSVPYLGQPAPEMGAARFAPSFIKGELHTSPVFMPDGSEVYWSSQESRIYTMKLENGHWTQPEEIAFSASLTDYRDPFIAPSGDKLFFLSKGKLPNSELPEKENIWFVERVDDSWGDPQLLGEEVNGLTLHWQVSVAASGNLYFTSGETGFEDIYVSKYIDDQYVKAEPLGEPINTEQYEATPYIAPDESYIIFARLKDQSSDPRLYISYADQDQNWREPVLIESVSYGLCPIVSPDGKYLFFLSSPESVSWMNTEFIRDLNPQSERVIQVRLPISPAMVKQLEPLYTLAAHTDRVTDLAFSGDGRYLASSGRDGKIRLWDVQNWQEVHAFSIEESDLNVIAFSPVESLLASSEAIWNVESRNVVHMLDQGMEAPGHVAFSPDGSLLAVAGFHQPVKLWDVDTGQALRTFDVPAGTLGFFNIVFSPDGKRLAAGGANSGEVILWEVETGQVIDTLEHGDQSDVHDVVFSPDGRLLAGGGTGAAIQVWDVASGESISRLWLNNGIYGLAFSPDGTMLASASCNRVADLYEVRSGKRLRSLLHADELMAVAFSPDGTLLATGGYDHMIVIWGIAR